MSDVVPAQVADEIEKALRDRLTELVHEAQALQALGVEDEAAALNHRANGVVDAIAIVEVYQS